MANLTGVAQIPNNVDAFYSRVLLKEAFPMLLHNRFAQTKNIPRNAGSKTIRFRRYTNLATATTPLTEGVTPTAAQLAITKIEAIALQYGSWVNITDVVDTVNVDPIFSETARLQGQQSGQTFDQITRDVLNAGTSVSYGGDATERVELAAGDVITAALIKAAVMTLKLNNASKLMAQMINATDGVGTLPVDRSYVGIVHPTLVATLKTLTGWVAVESYSSQMSVMAGEVGKLDEMRFIETTEAKIFTDAGASSEDVYTIVVLAQDAYGTTTIDGEALKSIRKGYGVGEDPLNQRATMGWKGWHVAEILNQDFITRIEVTAT